MIISKRPLIAVLATFFIAVPAIRSLAEAPPTTAPSPVAAPESAIAIEFKAIFEKITAKLKAGKNSETDLAPEVAEIDALIARHASEKTDEVAMLSLMKARLYLEIFENTDKGIALLKEIKVNFPQSKIAKDIDQAVSALEKQAAVASLLAVGKPFPAFAEKDLAGQPLALANFKGKFVLIDFWATWCGPCVGELPNVLAAYQKYHAKGFEVVGISLDRSRDALTSFVAENKMPWAQYFDAEGKLADQYGIQSIPSTFLLDGEGKIIAKNLRGDDLGNKLATLFN